MTIDWEIVSKKERADPDNDEESLFVGRGLDARSESIESRSLRKRISGLVMRRSGVLAIVTSE